MNPKIWATNYNQVMWMEEILFIIKMRSKDLKVSPKMSSVKSQKNVWLQKDFKNDYTCRWTLPET
jgi:hypothetical protein